MFNTAINFTGTSLQSSAGPVLYGNDGNYYNETSPVSFGATYTTGDVIGVAVDYDNNLIWFSKNGTFQASGNPAAGTNGRAFGSGRTWGTGYVESGSSVSPSTYSINFGQQPFAYTPPAGFLSLCTTNLPNPTILQGNQYFDVSLYTGNATARNIINSGSMSPDLVWIKERSAAGWNMVYDTNRGALNTIHTNSTNAEASLANTLTGFNSDGFALGTDAGGFGVNRNGISMVAWQWRGSDSTAVTNTAGSITSTVSANTSAGFSVVTYTGTGANATVGHGLGVAPRMVIVKRRNSTGNWPVFHSNAGNEAVGFLNLTNAFSSPETTYWNATSPTSTVFSVGTNAAVNASGGTYVAYVFAQVEGYSSIGRYTGNGSADGTFVYTGFRPRYIMIKNRDAAGFDWILMDTSRDPSNVATQELYADLNIAEGTAANNLDILSNGFKIRRNNAAVNTNGGAYMYIAFAENPFKNALAR
jgi:hypothetical protein